MWIQQGNMDTNKKQKNHKPIEPDTPKSNKISQFKIKKYETELKWYYNKMNKYKKDKAIVFINIIRQYTLPIKNIEN